MKKPDKWTDPRTPVSVTQVGKWKVTIYDQGLYDESLRLYGDNNQESPVAKVSKRESEPIRKYKPAARYNWTKSILQIPISKRNEDAFSP